MKVILIRHSRTAGNLQKRYAGGATDEPLCPEGEAMVAAAGSYPQVKQVFVSPMLRAKQTAEGLFPHAEQIVLEGLREMNFGEFEGKTADEMADNPAYHKWVADFCLSQCPGGEDVVTVGKRVMGAMAQAETQTKEETAIFVAHGGSIMSMLLVQGLDPKELAQWMMPNLAATAGEWKNGKLVNCKLYATVKEALEDQL